jgi:uncharacterized protein with HEPN domain
MISSTSVIWLRHRVVHDYMHVNLDIVWDVVTDDLAPLTTQLVRLLPEEWR